MRACYRPAMRQNEDVLLLCSECDKPMPLFRVTPQLGSLPKLHTYFCRPCGEALMTGLKRPQLVASFILASLPRLSLIHACLPNPIRVPCLEIRAIYVNENHPKTGGIE